MASRPTRSRPAAEDPVEPPTASELQDALTEHLHSVAALRAAQEQNDAARRRVVELLHRWDIKGFVL